MVLTPGNIMKTTWVLAAMAVMLMHWPAHGAEPTSRPAGGSVNQLTVEQLIDRLPEITNKEYSVRTNIFALGGDGKGRLGQGLLMLQDPGPTPAEAMTELTRRGVSALPQLLAHLDDARKTEAAIPVNHWSAEFDRNLRTSKTHPKGVIAPGSLDHDAKPSINIPKDRPYFVAVGDLCFNIIGEIVNRRYEAVRYQPTMVVISNSPVLCPDLRDAVRAEWANLTPEQHRESLLADVTRPDHWGRDSGGIIALWRYYPEAAPAAVKKRLEAPHFDHQEIEDFAEKQLYVTVDARERKRLIDEFIARNGPAYRDGLVVRLWQDRWMNKSNGNVQVRTVPVAPTQILDELVPNREADRMPEVSAVAYNATDGFIEALQEVPSVEINALVWGIFKEHCTNHGDTWSHDDGTASSCVKQLAHKGHDAELLAFCRRRQKELAQPGNAFEELIGLLTNEHRRNSDGPR